MALMDMVMDMVMDIMERERLRLKLLLLLSQDTTMAIMDMVDMAIMDIMERERLRLSQDITMDILIMVDMAMDIMARGKLRQMLLLSPVITIMDILMEAMVIMVKQATIYLFKNFSKLKRVSLNLVKRNT